MSFELEHARADDFAEHVGSGFDVQTEDGVVYVTLTLRSAERSSRAGDHPRPFSLVFEGPADTPLEQNTYALRHQALGDMWIFIVPIGASPDKRSYEAVFN